MAEANAGEAASWQSGIGQTWVRQAQQVDALQGEVTAELIRRASISPGDAVLDVGCGAGASTRAAAAAAGPGGRVTALDIAPAMLEAAARAGEPGVTYVEGDAQDHAFDAGTYDRIISQFGVMFFADSVAAVANLRRAARPGGRLIFAAWAGPEENPWFHLARAAGVAELGDAPGDPDGPGPTRFRDRAGTAALVEEAGWTEVAAEAVRLDLTPRGPLAEVADLATRLGPAARLLRVHGADDAARARVVARLEAAFAPFARKGRVRIPALVNFVSASAP